jgi:hypothetical protein
MSCSKTYKIYPSHRTIVFLKPVNQGSHTVVPELDGRRMQGYEDPWALAVEGDALSPRGLGLELLK